MSNEITIYDKITDPLKAIDEMGKWMHQSAMFGCKSVEQGKVIAMACIAERKNPLEIMRTYHIIDNKLSMRADAMLAEYNNRGGKHRVVSQTPDCAEVVLAKDGTETAFRFTWAEAQQEKYPYSNKIGADNKPMLKDNWSTPRQRALMLWARCVSNAVRTVDPAVVAGYYAPEEIADFQPQEIQAQTAAKPLFSKQPDAPLHTDAEVVDEAAADAAAAEGEKRRVEIVCDLIESLGLEKTALAEKWLIANGRLTTGQKLENLSLPQAEKIAANFGAFEKAIQPKTEEVKA